MTLDGRWQLELRGLRVGAGTPYRFDGGGLDGMGTPPIDASDSDRVGNGETADFDRYKARTLRAGLVVTATLPDVAEVAADALKAAFQLSPVDIPLELRLYKRSYTAIGRPRRCELDTSNLRNGIVRAAVEFKALDPRLYWPATEPLELSLTGTQETGGLTVPVDSPILLGGIVGPATITNFGNAATHAVIEFIGGDEDTDNPYLENAANGHRIQLAHTLAAGQTVTVDTQSGIPTLNGVERYDLLDLVESSPTWLLESGVNSVTFRADTYNPTARARVAWRSATI